MVTHHCQDAGVLVVPEPFSYLNHSNSLAWVALMNGCAVANPALLVHGGNPGTAVKQAKVAFVMKNGVADGGPYNKAKHCFIGTEACTVDAQLKFARGMSQIGGGPSSTISV